MGSKKPVETRWLEDFFLLAVGMLLFSISVFTSILPAALAGIAFLVGSALIVMFLFDTAKIIRQFNSVKNFVVDKSGLTWIWIVGLVLAIPFCAVVYWVLAYPFDLLVAHMAGIYTFTGIMASSWDAVRIIISYLLAFALIYAVMWVIINAKNPGGY